MLVEAAEQKVSKHRKDAEDDARVLSLAESVGNMGHWYWQTETYALTWSDQVYLIYGQDAATFSPTFQSFLDQFHASDRDRVQAHLRQATEQKSSFEFDARIVTPCGFVRNIIAKGQPEVSATGQLIAMFGVVTDVTDAFQTLQAIRDQKEMLDLAASVAGIGHWVWDPDNRCIVFCSDHLAKMFGTTEHGIVRSVQHPTEFARYIYEQDATAYAETVRRQISAVESYETEYRCDVSGEIRFFREIGRPIVSDDGDLQRYIATVQDITTRVRREDELQSAKRDLESVVAAKDQLFSIIGHDLKTPFNQIIGFASLLQESAVELTPEKVREYSHLIADAAQNTSQLLDTLLQWAASESEMLPLKQIDFDLACALEDGIRPLRSLADAKSVLIDVDMRSVYVSADRDMVETVLRNLINNAVKFCRSGDRITIRATQDETDVGRICVEVADTGVGMGDEQVRVLVDGAPAQSKAGTGGELGSGLGLRLCRNLIRRHGGDFSIDSQPGAGCVVRFSLPAASSHS